MNANNATSIKLDVYQLVTDQIIALLEKGTVPWKQPWTDAGIPCNLLSKRAYRGINLWLLLSLGFEKNLFLTWEQIKNLGGSVNKGEKGQIVIFWKTSKKENGEEQPEENKEQQTKTKSLLRYYKVFNVAQCNNLPESIYPPAEIKDHSPIITCENIVSGMTDCPAIKHKEPLAYYHIEKDFINMPKRNSFSSIESYYATLFHELVHSTGHEKRLNRATLTEMAEFGSDAYSQEELIAELGSCFLVNHAGILPTVIENSAAYIGGWLEKFKNDKRFVVQAAGQAQKAADAILENPTFDIQ
jgi:antirestriction protein ArdC